MFANAYELFKRLPKPANAIWSEGVPFVQALSDKTMSVELFALRGEDKQFPHDQDELYFVLEGSASFWMDGEVQPLTRGAAVFVAAGKEHRFLNTSPDFLTWVVFWGPKQKTP